MLFNSPIFALFFIVTTVVYYALPHTYRRTFLLLASCVFYMWAIPKYIVILFLTITIDYVAALLFEKCKTPSLRRAVLAVSVCSTCLILFVFKYFNFFAANLNEFARLIHWNYSTGTLSLLLPIGLSFHTFQSLSYVVEVYRGRVAPERNFGIYALYVMFYPQLVAGPIERPQQLLPQFHAHVTLRYENVAAGLRLMAWGFFKKVVIADRLASYVDSVYNDVGAQRGPALILATIFFAFQIYCDFSGYTDIARGTAKVLGFDLMENFNRPYASRSVGEFWQRWHISLSSWFRDYLYIPLGGNRVSRLRLYMNLLITFAVSGLWHGANWTYLIWGGLNGGFIIAAIAGQPFLKKFTPRPAFIDVGVTFLLICFTWIFFRANNVADAKVVVTHLATGFTAARPLSELLHLGYPFGMSNLILSIILLVVLETIQYAIRDHDFNCLFVGQSAFFATRPLLRWTFYYALVLTIVYVGFFTGNRFIYFQF